MISRISQLRHKLPAFLRNKYLLTGLLFVAWLLFFDRNDIFSQYRLRQDLGKVRDERDFFRNEISRDSTRIRQLLNDPENLEKFARETYLMKRDNEDIFVVVESALSE